MRGPRIALLVVSVGCGKDDALAEGTGSCSDEPPTDSATLCGVITRSVEPSAGGVGTIYLGLTDLDPAWSPDDATWLAQAVLEDCDLSEDGAEVPYLFEGLPVGDEARYLGVFLDDNANADSDPPLPDKGDLVVFEDMGSPEVVLDEAGDRVIDIDLNFVKPI